MLTGIQERLLGLLASGRSADEVAATLCLPEAEMKQLVRAVLRRLAIGEQSERKLTSYGDGLSP